MSFQQKLTLLKSDKLKTFHEVLNHDILPLSMKLRLYLTLQYFIKDFTGIVLILIKYMDINQGSLTRMARQQIAKDCLTRLITEIIDRDSLIDVIEALEEFTEVYDMIFSLTNLI